MAQHRRPEASSTAPLSGRLARYFVMGLPVFSVVMSYLLPALFHWQDVQYLTNPLLRPEFIEPAATYAAGALAIYLLLYGLVRRADRLIATQQHDLPSMNDEWDAVERHETTVVGNGAGWSSQTRTRLAGAVGGRLEAGDLDFTEIGEVRAEEGGEGVVLGGAVRDVVDHGKRKGPVYIGLKKGGRRGVFTQVVE